MIIFCYVDAVIDAVGRKTEVLLLKLLPVEIKPSRFEARIIVRLFLSFYVVISV